MKIKTRLEGEKTILCSYKSNSDTIKLKKKTSSVLVFAIWVIFVNTNMRRHWYMFTETRMSA